MRFADSASGTTIKLFLVFLISKTKLNAPSNPQSNLFFKNLKFDKLLNKYMRFADSASGTTIKLFVFGFFFNF